MDYIITIKSRNIISWGSEFTKDWSWHLKLYIASNQYTYFSLPAPPIAILWLSPVQSRSLTGPAKGWNSFFSMCSAFTVSQILSLPVVSEMRVSKITIGLHIINIHELKSCVDPVCCMFSKAAKSSSVIILPMYEQWEMNRDCTRVSNQPFSCAEHPIQQQISRK